MEYVLWGIPKDQDEEMILYTKATTKERAVAAKMILESKFECTNVRIQELDMSKEDISEWGPK